MLYDNHVLVRNRTEILDKFGTLVFKLISRIRVISGKLVVVQLTRNYPLNVETEGSLSCLQQAATGLFYEAGECSSRSHTLLL
jgi:hypothetical protein